jgi:hypothetical protein
MQYFLSAFWSAFHVSYFALLDYECVCGGYGMRAGSE